MNRIWYLSDNFIYRRPEYWPAILMLGLGCLFLTLVTMALPGLVAFLFGALLLCSTLALFVVAYKVRKWERQNVRKGCGLW